MPSLVLASASPRRRELLATLGVSFRAVPGDADESLPPELGLAAALEEVARRKARGVAGRISGDPWILAADTVVAVGGKVLGKPRDRAEAEEMLRTLAGRTHRVITAVALVRRDVGKTLAVETRVVFCDLSDDQIEWYASTPEPYDKAGGYAIQGRGAFLVSSIRGSYTNVVGLPMSETAALLEEIGLAPWAAAGEEP